MRAVLLSIVAAAIGLSCRHLPAQRDPELSFIAGSLDSRSCSPFTWNGPWGEVEMCVDASAPLDVPRREIYAALIEDRDFDGTTWYLVSVRMTEPIMDRLAQTLEGAYAVSVDGRITFASRTLVDYWRVVVAATRERSEAERIAHALGSPVDRMISSELVEQPLASVSIVELIANPSRWFGKRVAVQGFLDSTLLELYLSREHAQVRDASSVLVNGPTSEQQSLAWSKCQDSWVLVHAVADRDAGGAVRLVRVERLWSIPNGPHCQDEPKP